jgi:hypothetical protein
MTERGWRLAKGKNAGTRKIDALIALLLAYTVATAEDGGIESVYEDRDLLTI